ncbi:MAG: hypothetical protein M5R40_26080 [Anaerolineae bacterium]|nr:hypothetical protein [Anaerolineae bacterium]
MPEKLAIGITNLDNKTAFVAPALKIDRYLVDGQWRRRDDGWQHGQQVEMVTVPIATKSQPAIKQPCSTSPSSLSATSWSPASRWWSATG